MKKSILYAMLFLFTPVFAASLDEQVERAVAAAVSVENQQVEVLAQLVKPVYASDVMFRRPRGRNVVIAKKRKENACTGLWDGNAQRLYMPATCVKEDGYRIAALRVTFTSGRMVTIPGRVVKIVGDLALVTF